MIGSEMEVVVIDGQGGGIGRSVIEALKKEVSGTFIIAVGTKDVYKRQVGYKSKHDLFDKLKNKYTYVYNLGDSKEVRNIRGAIWDAYEVARNL